MIIHFRPAPINAISANIVIIDHMPKVHSSVILYLFCYNRGVRWFIGLDFGNRRFIATTHIDFLKVATS